MTTLVLSGNSSRYYNGTPLIDSEPYLEDDVEGPAIKNALEKVMSKEDTIGEIGVFPVRE